MFCSKCGKELPDAKTLKQCPQCGQPLKKSSLRTVIGCSCLAALLMFGGVLLPAIIAPNMVRAKAQGQLSACQSNLKNIAAACEMFASDNKGRYPQSLEQLEPNYLKYLPDCPAAHKMNYVYKPGSDFKAYTVCCSGSFHKAAGEGADFPKFDSKKGLQTRALPIRTKPGKRR